ncbi:uncharacterized protein BO97DRAFT_345648 [Aspergillus homomorphus CBS 101889]|uniref:RRM domain-containing protein n=1 Tax=Aspergillus homomorphus (strain CBS 101889) TaxID=1450537 RepID=A0A395HW40_ASPHC|nr:hypothetical protein BO97DRAFT_345648 [Aspergillus homomorphus CBS 101889]RAL12132.1 hypothetical protein BO97DRAFT_345648 [Aspergillus homomorphus CBS 101889]
MPVPTSSRDRGRTTKQGRPDEEFVLFLQGIPAHCRWQELKDLVRQTALHIRQAVVYDDQHGFPTGLGQIIVKNEDEAWRTYQRLSTNGWEGQSLVVTLARTSSPTRPVAGPTKSPTRVMPANYVAGYSTPPRVVQNMAVPPSPISPELTPHRPSISTSPTYPNSEYGLVMDVMSMPQQPLLPIITDPTSQHAVPAIPQSPATLRRTFRDTYNTPILPSYPMHAGQPLVEAPTNTRFGTTGRRTQFTRKPIYNYLPNPSFTPHAYHQPSSVTGAPRSPLRRTIFVQNLSPATNGLALRDFFQDSGVTVEHCEVPIDLKFGRCKGFARVTLRTPEEAKHTINLYNGCTFLGTNIRVRMDRSIPQMGPFTPADRANPASTSTTNNNNNNKFAYRPSNGQAMRSTTTPQDHHAPTGPRSEASTTEKPSPSSSPSASATKPADRCGPLVVNGSGTGRSAVAT